MRLEARFRIGSRKRWQLPRREAWRTGLCSAWGIGCVGRQLAACPTSYFIPHSRCEPDRGGGGGGDAGMAGEELFSVQCTERVEMMAGDRCTPYTWRRVRWGPGRAAA